MIHSEYLTTANKQYELIHNNNGDGLHCFIFNTDVLIYKNIMEASTVFGGKVDYIPEPIRTDTNGLDQLVENNIYDYDTAKLFIEKYLANQLKLELHEKN